MGPAEIRQYCQVDADAHERPRLSPGAQAGPHHR
jgi:hypothetical protein